MPHVGQPVYFGLSCLWVLVLGMTGFAQTSSMSTEEHKRRANEFLSARQPEKAMVELSAVVAAEPANIDAQANLGVLLHFAGRHGAAIEHLREALRLSPDLPKLQGLLGLSEYQLQQIEPAQQDLSAALDTISEPQFRKQVGLALVEIDAARLDFIKAADVVSTLLQQAPSDPELLYASYRIHTDMAGDALLSLSLAAPQSGEMQQAIAHELMRNRDVAGAIASFRKAIVANPNLPGIHFELGEALRESDSQENRAAAEHEYALALERNPREVQAAVRLGDFHSDRGELDLAATLYQRALGEQPNNADALLGMSRVLSERNENEKALPLLEQVLQADPTNMLAHFRLSALYRKLHRPEDARRELADYQKYKAIKDKLREVYVAMRTQEPHNLADLPTEPDAASKVRH